MNQVNEGNNLDAMPNIPVKRKRGRPRKDQSVNRERARVPPGFEGSNENQPRQVDPIEDANDSMVGQAVTGVVEAAFDAGYLLTVSIGNSNACLRGVVFKPGHYVPVSAENDVAPHVRMINRNEIHLATENRTRVRRHKLRSHHVNFHGNETALVLSGSPPANLIQGFAPQTANLIASKRKHVSPVATSIAPPVSSRGTVVPVVLQPVNISNGLSPANQIPLSVSQSAQAAAQKGQQVEAVAIQGLHHETNYEVTPKSVQNEGNHFHGGTPEVLHGDGARSINLTDASMQDKTNERIEASLPSPERHTENGKLPGKSTIEVSEVTLEGGIGNMNEPLLIEPLQAIRSDAHSQSAPVHNSLESNRTGRMTELLQALQENMTENQASGEHAAAYSKQESSSETDLGDEETLQ